MPSPDLLLAQLRKEWREVVSGNAFWALLLLVSGLAGTGFLQAVELYGEASRTAARSPELAAGLSPLDGIFTPTFGALYLATTFLFPFVALRLVGGEKQTGSLKLQLQMPLSPAALVAVKAAALAAAWLATAAPLLLAVAFWRSWGGHVHLPEVGTLLLGHLLYAAAIGGIALLLAAICESPATAAIGTLAAVMASFVLDFAGAAATGFWKAASALSLTASVRAFERGLLDAWLSARLVLLAAALLALASVWLPTGRPLRRKGLVSGLVLAAFAALTAGAMALPPASLDASEDRRNSFDPADERALAEMTGPLSVTIHLAPEDSRAQEFEANVLAKLRRTVRRLAVAYADAGAAFPFGSPGDDRYGTIVWEYGGAREESRSTSAREILPILHALAQSRVAREPVPRYPGYPLAVEGTAAPRAAFYLVLPALVLVLWRLERTRPERIRRRLR